MNVSSELSKQIALDLSHSTPILMEDERKAFAAKQLSQALLKKLEPTDSSLLELLRETAISNFKVVNASITDTFVNDSEDERVRSAIARAKDRLAQCFPSNAWYEPSPTKGKFGPGSSEGVQDCDPYGKHLELSYSNATCLHFYVRHVMRFDPAPGYVSGLVRRARKAITRLTTVRKNDKTDRTIAIEPSCNMFLQQAIRSDLERLLKEQYGLDLANQQVKNRRLAYIGSIAGRYGTIDLSNASDTIGYAFAKWFLPHDLMSWLEVARAERIDIDGEEVEARMLSTMGNATTFPVQCLIFASLVLGVYEVLKLVPSTSSRYFYGRNGKSAYGVNGDDIIVVAEAYDLMVKVLQACGFQPNLEKSFNTGAFRESCGGDFYRGYPVRGIYVKTLNAPQGVYSAINRLRMWSVFHDIPLRNTLRWLTSLAEKLEKQSGGGLKRVPIWMPVDSGIHDESGSGRYSYWKPKRPKRSVPWYDTMVAWLAWQDDGLLTCGDNVLTVGIRDPDVKYCLRRGSSHNWDNPKPHVKYQWVLPIGTEVQFCEEWHFARLGPEISHLGIF